MLAHVCSLCCVMMLDQASLKTRFQVISGRAYYGIADVPLVPMAETLLLKCELGSYLPHPFARAKILEGSHCQ
jgi:hypothetical protein